LPAHNPASSQKVCNFLPLCGKGWDIARLEEETEESRQYTEKKGNSAMVESAIADDLIVDHYFLKRMLLLLEMGKGRLSEEKCCNVIFP
jgi:hypothetical protein